MRSFYASRFHSIFFEVATQYSWKNYSLTEKIEREKRKTTKKLVPERKIYFNTLNIRLYSQLEVEVNLHRLAFINHCKNRKYILYSVNVNGGIWAVSIKHERDDANANSTAQILLQSQTLKWIFFPGKHKTTRENVCQNDQCLNRNLFPSGFELRVTFQNHLIYFNSSFLCNILMFPHTLMLSMFSE